MSKDKRNSNSSTTKVGVSNTVNYSFVNLTNEEIFKIFPYVKSGREEEIPNYSNIDEKYKTKVNIQLWKISVEDEYHNVRVKYHNERLRKVNERIETEKLIIEKITNDLEKETTLYLNTVTTKKNTLEQLLLKVK